MPKTLRPKPRKRRRPLKYSKTTKGLFLQKAHLQHPIYRPFTYKDYISVAGFEGTVVEIDLRYTTIHGDGKTILIPNSVLFTNSIVVVEKDHGLPH